MCIAISYVASAYFLFKMHVHHYSVKLMIPQYQYLNRIIESSFADFGGGNHFCAPPALTLLTKRGEELSGLGLSLREEQTLGFSFSYISFQPRQDDRHSPVK